MPPAPENSRYAVKVIGRFDQTMPDVWASVPDLDGATQKRLAEVLEARGADPQQQGMRRTFLSEIAFPTNAAVLDVGCGTGVLSRVLAGSTGIGTVVGVDPAPSLIEEARMRAAGQTNLSFEVADGRALPFEDRAFDVVVFDSTLSHVPEPERAVAEAYRVLRSGGWIASFDGDYATTTVALGENDPLQACVDAMMANSVNDRWLMRRLPGLFMSTGFEQPQFHSFGYADIAGSAYMLSVVDRGIDIQCSGGQISDGTAGALKAEVRRRADAGTFFGHIAYAGVLARRPA